MTSPVPTRRPRMWGSGVKVAEWVGVTAAVSVAVFFVVAMLGFHMDYALHTNRVLAWSAVAGGVGFSAWYAWIGHARDRNGGRIRDIPSSVPVLWSLTSATALWLAAALVDRSRLDWGSAEYGALVPRVPVVWGMWVPLAAVAALSLLTARKFGLVRSGLASLPLQALWWWAVLLASS